jgi:FkbM family methyltransferase
MRIQTETRRTLYEHLGRLWPVRRGHGRWLDVLQRGLGVGPYAELRALPVGSCTVWLDPGDANDRYMYFGVAGGGNSALMKELLRPGDVVIDGGANVGFFAATCVSLGARVYAIEANPELCKRLERTATGGSISVHNVALWREPAELDFNVATVTGWSSLVENPTFRAASKIRVRAVTLDGFVDEQHIDRIRVLKLDLEGAETDALMGARGLLERGAIDYVLVESDIHRLTAFGYTGRELDALLTKAGYFPERVIDSERVLPMTASRRMPGSFNGDHLYARRNGQR